MCLIFSYLGVTIVLDPDEELKGHGLSFKGAEAAVYAEIRAFYGGCFGTLALVYYTGWVITGDDSVRLVFLPHSV